MSFLIAPAPQRRLAGSRRSLQGWWHRQNSPGRPGPPEEDGAILSEAERDKRHTGSMAKSPLAGLNVLLLEDEALLRRRLTGFLEKERAEVTAVNSLSAARHALESLTFEAALIDVNLPDGRGTDLLRQKLFPPTTTVIVMTAEGGVAGAIEALQAGAADYLVKPFDPEELPVRFAQARRNRQVKRVDEFRRGQETELIFGESLAGVREQLAKITVADRRLGGHLSPVLIEGETGTGKTAIARWIHRHGPRAEEPLVELNCSALPEALAEAELFGHERGAFTDAKAARIGLMEAADGGTLFLDELPSLALPLQAKLLTTIEDLQLRRVGASRSVPVDARSLPRPMLNSDRWWRAGFGRTYAPAGSISRAVPVARPGRRHHLLAENCWRGSAGGTAKRRQAIPAEGRKRCSPTAGLATSANLREIERAVVFGGERGLTFPHLGGPEAFSTQARCELGMFSD